MNRRLLRLSSIAVVALLTSAHVGSPDVVFRGEVGPYTAWIDVRPPTVVPGRAFIFVKVETPGVERITIQATRWDLGAESAPAPEAVPAVDGSPGLYSSSFWLMTAGSHRITVTLHGNAGDGSTVLPVMALVLGRLPLTPGRGVLLLGFGLLLFCGCVSLAGAATREGSLRPGEIPDNHRQAAAGRARMGTGAVLLLLVAAGWIWWGRLDQLYQRDVYQARTLTASVGRDSGRALRLDLSPSRRRGHAKEAFIPDHGKLMHLFLVGENGCGRLPTYIRCRLPDRPLRRRCPRFLVAGIDSMPTWSTSTGSPRRLQGRSKWRLGSPGLGSRPTPTMPATVTGQPKAASRMARP